MAARYDVEQMLRDIETLFKAKLNDEILIVDAEKADFVLDPINDRAWYLNQLPRTFSYNPFIVWGLEEQPVTDTQPGNWITNNRFFLEAVVSDSGQKEAVALVWRLLRYSRALGEVARKNFDMFQGRAKAKVQSLIPTSFVLDGKLYRAAGIRIEASLNAS